jgi:hypothetical protein
MRLTSTWLPPDRGSHTHPYFSCGAQFTIAKRMLSRSLASRLLTARPAAAPGLHHQRARQRHTLLLSAESWSACVLPGVQLHQLTHASLFPACLAYLFA